MIKFAIWGCGTRGRMAVDILGIKRIECFIDNNEVYVDTRYKGIPVYTYSYYKQKEMRNPVIISPLGKEEEIREQLTSDDREISFLLEDEIAALREVFYEYGAEKITGQIPHDRDIFIYGRTILSILIVELLREKNVDIMGIIPHGADDGQKDLYNTLLEVEKYKMAGLKDEDYVILTVPLRERECRIADKKNLSVFSLYNIGSNCNLFYNKRLEKFKNIHCGERCFIVATGPSLTMEDLETLKENNEICISVNGILKAFDHTGWHPDYYVVSDPFCTYTWKDEIIDMNVGEKFIADYAWNYGDLDISNMYKFHLLREGNNQPGFSQDFARYSCHGNTVVYDGALQLAAYMGFKEIYLLGVDCNLHKASKHFIEGYACNKFDDDDQIFVLNAYRTAEKYSRENNFRIYNATRGGELEIFERVDFDRLFNKGEKDEDCSDCSDEIK